MAGGLEEITSNGVSTTLTKYFGGANGLPTAERVGTNGPLSYLASDGQGTVSEALDGGGNVTFAQLYTPYGNARYSSGSSPTTLGYTGQRADSATGLDYYQARYYDPVAGQFGSADTVNDGLNRYGYVHGNPTTATDPTGHRCYIGDGGVCGSPGSSPVSTPPPPNVPIVKACPTGRPCSCPVTGCQPKPEPAPCANKQNQCTNPNHWTAADDAQYWLGQLQDIAWNAEATFWDLMDSFQNWKDFLSRWFKDLPDVTGGLLDAALKGFDRAISDLQDLKQDFFLQRNWNMDQWNPANLASFEARVEAHSAALALALNALSVSLALLPAPGPVIGAWIAPGAAGNGIGFGVASSAFLQENGAVPNLYLDEVFI